MANLMLNIIAYEQVKENVFAVAYITANKKVAKAIFENVSGTENMMLSGVCAKVPNIDSFINYVNNGIEKD